LVNKHPIADDGQPEDGEIDIIGMDSDKDDKTSTRRRRWDTAGEEMKTHPGVFGFKVGLDGQVNLSEYEQVKSVVVKPPRQRKYSNKKNNDGRIVEFVENNRVPLKTRRGNRSGRPRQRSSQRDRRVNNSRLTQV
jgi:hypothetical protein